ncbi:MAG TPA: carbonic anhydrase family protein [Rubrivivax sp.]|nr:carbonic anhydrase family protein [Rubrivivax sp.]HPO17666.1 carbonic anhydrase family protein [Rubrivivax sp.]
MDRLQRRLAEVLGPSVSVDAARAGELRVLTRSAVPAAGSSASAAAAARQWGYAGLTGPRRWARLDPAFAGCASGREQSPIDLRGGIAARLEPVRFDYRAGRFGVLDAGHTVQAVAPPGNAIEFGGTRYELQQLHFHRPSEERIDGRQFEMDVHLVHRDAQGRLAVVAVLLQRGAAQPLLHAVWQQLAPAADDDSAVPAEIDPNQLLPQDRRYYSYMGSLTTPPCTEGVRWLVLRQPLTVSAPQIDAFAQRYPMNARPLQPAAGRVIRQSM